MLSLPMMSMLAATHDCAGLSTERAAFCMSYTQPAISEEAGKYRDRRANCNWRDVSGNLEMDAVVCRNKADYETMIGGTSPTLEACERPSPVLHSCIMADWEDPNAVWVIRRVGPFQSRGGVGYDWTEVNR